MSTSESERSPPTLQWIFAKVTVNDGREEQRVDDRLPPAHVVTSARSSSAVSSTRVERASWRRHSSDSATSGRPPFGSGDRARASASLSASTSSERHDDSRSGLADQIGCSAVGRHRGEDRTPCRDVLEHLPREHALAASAGVRDQQQEGLGVALQGERRRSRRVGDQLEPVAEVELVGPLAVGAAEVAEKTRDGIDPGVVQRLQERPWVALAEEAAGVRDPQAPAGSVVEALEVVEVGAVRDRHDPASWLELPHLVRDEVRHAHDRVGRPGDEPRDPDVDLLLRAHGRALGSPVGVRDGRVAKVCDPADAGRALRRPLRPGGSSSAGRS